MKLRNIDEFLQSQHINTTYKIHQCQLYLVFFDLCFISAFQRNVNAVMENVPPMQLENLEAYLINHVNLDLIRLYRVYSVVYKQKGSFFFLSVIIKMHNESNKLLSSLIFCNVRKYKWQNARDETNFFITSLN